MQLKVHKKRMEESKLRDHRTVGSKMNLFSIQEDAGGGLVFWHPKGALIRRQIEDYWKDEHVKVSIIHVTHMYKYTSLVCLYTHYSYEYVYIP